jgi:F0F1-type ATP synthase alpha subunit
MKKFQTLMIFAILMVPCISPLNTLAQQEIESQKSVDQKNEEMAVKSAVENFLTALGNDETEKVKLMMLPNANIGSIHMSDGESQIFTVTADQYLSDREGKENRKFKEPVSKYTVNISQGILAFVRADATVYYDGVANYHTNDFFVLMKDNDAWKFLSASYTTLPLESDK